MSREGVGVSGSLLIIYLKSKEARGKLKKKNRTKGILEMPEAFLCAALMWKMPQIIKKKIGKNASKGIKNAKIEELGRFLLSNVLPEVIFQKGRRN